jgi:hypothetical protein
MTIPTLSWLPAFVVRDWVNSASSHHLRDPILFENETVGLYLAMFLWSNFGALFVLAAKSALRFVPCVF